MKDTLKPLWERIERFEIDAPHSEFSFSDRLAHENGWSKDYSLRVIGEYKRFLYLCCEAGHHVAPPVDVDEAWHLHLCYTRSYWDQLCGSTIGRPIHHGPTKGGDAERDKFVDWYQKTLDSYQSHFGEAPPTDIWPATEKRFEPDHRQKVDPKQHLIVHRRSAITAVAATAGALALAGCTQLFAEDDGGILFFVSGLIVFALILKSFQSGGGGGGKGGGCGAAGGCGDSGSGGCGGGGSGCGGGCGGGG